MNCTKAPEARGRSLPPAPSPGTATSWPTPGRNRAHRLVRATVETPQAWQDPLSFHFRAHSNWSWFGSGHAPRVTTDRILEWPSASDTTFKSAPCSNINEPAVCRASCGDQCPIPARSRASTNRWRKRSAESHDARRVVRRVGKRRRSSPTPLIRRTRRSCARATTATTRCASPCHRSARRQTRSEPRSPSWVASTATSACPSPWRPAPTTA